MITVVTSTTTSSAPYRSVSSTPLARPMLAKIRPTSPRGIMPRPISSLSARVPDRAQRRRDLAHHSDHRQHRGQPEHARLGHRPEVGVDADLHEEDRDQDVADRTEVAADPLVVIAPARSQARP